MTTKRYLGRCRSSDNASETTANGHIDSSVEREPERYLEDLCPTNMVSDSHRKDPRDGAARGEVCGLEQSYRTSRPVSAFVT